MQRANLSSDKTEVSGSSPEWPTINYITLLVVGDAVNLRPQKAILLGSAPLQLVIPR